MVEYIEINVDCQKVIVLKSLLFIIVLFFVYIGIFSTQDLFLELSAALWWIENRIFHCTIVIGMCIRQWNLETLDVLSYCESCIDEF